MAKTYRLTLIRRLANTLMKAALNWGLGPPGIMLLTVRGRKTGRSYSTPVSLVRQNGERYLVSPYGERSWVRNARSAGEVTLSKGRKAEVLKLQSLGPAGAAPVLREYWRANTVARGFFDATANSPDEDFAREADRHPVFRLL